LGFEGKWAIHPTQIELANAVFSPEPKEIESAKRIFEAMEVAQAAGRGAVALDGKLVDIASIRMAENLIAKAKTLGMLHD
jgi:malyl-CoA/(S)-citramalyl-CoA lyase